ncbi:cell number regulator 8 isoform X2 [Beta vulgaris subsp. vulgaris]|uniref:cell number regulator 8 isoform X2 n=1 Tax=Beta vulgaris subsp. vulgaris TaxID=3555 RepID=UPI002548CA86|nr:cell number regulator 8 isoform X2 [Beta vulgaris subsp. vulgaris]
MANNLEESNPLLGAEGTHNNQSNLNDDDDIAVVVSKKMDENVDALSPSKQPPVPTVAQPQVAETYGWAAHGLPLGQPVMGRAHWNSGLCSCLGRSDDFCSSDLEVCLLGSVAPCILYGSNVERLGSSTGSFYNHCLSYAALYLIGNSFFGWNCVAPWFSYTSRTAVRRMFNLEVSCEALTRQCSCSGSFLEDEVQREQCETACDFATHVFCHPCSLCQEGREIRRRLPHPGFNAQPVLVMIPPGEQAMGREKA